MLCVRHPDLAAEGACQRCGTFYCSSCLQWVGQQRVCAECAARLTAVPWDERSTQGIIRTFGQTAWKMISSPVQTLAGARTSADQGYGGSALYLLLCAIIGYGPTIATYVPIFALGMSKSLFAKAEGAELSSAIWVGIMLGYFVFAIASNVAFGFVFSGIEVLMLRLFGFKEASYQTQVRAYALSSSPSLLGVIPICSLYIFPLWSLVLRVIVTRELQRCTVGQAVGAVLGPMFLCCGLGTAGYLAVIAGAVMMGK